MIKAILLTGALSTFFSLSAFGLEESLCKSNETMIASCHLKEGKKRVVSLCASADRFSVVYRFGTESALELIKDFSIQNLLSRWVDLGNYTAYFGFRLPPYTYVFGVPQQTYGARAFLDVYRNDEVVMSRECTDNSFGETALISEAIKEVPDDVVRSNKFIFPPQ